MPGAGNYRSSKPRRNLSTRPGRGSEREATSRPLASRSAERPARTPRTPKTFNADSMRGRLAIRAVTMNLSGQSVMGLTPAYKINYIRSVLALTERLTNTLTGNTWRHSQMSSSYRTESRRRTC